MDVELLMKEEVEKGQQEARRKEREPRVEQVFVSEEAVVIFVIEQANLLLAKNWDLKQISVVD